MMQNKPYLLPLVAIDAWDENSKALTFDRPAEFQFEPGQYVLLSLPGQNQAPIAVASGMRDPVLQFSLRAYGDVTRALSVLRPGDCVAIEGPYGTAFPLERCLHAPETYLIAGGTGITPVRSVARSLLPQVRAHLFYGAQSASALLYHNEIPTWGLTAHLAVDTAHEHWEGSVGTVLQLLQEQALHADAVAFVCGPPAMLQAGVAYLRSAGLSDDNIFVSVERLDAQGRVMGPVFNVTQASM